MTSGRVPDPRESMQPAAKWQGETYYGRQQVKPAPFDPNVVGGYIFLAGLSGAAALLGRNLLIYGLGGIIVPFIGIKVIDLAVTALHLA